MTETNKPKSLIKFNEEILSKELVKQEDITPMFETTTRGDLVVRVTPQGKFINKEIILITGSFVSGRAGPDSVKKIYARRLRRTDQGSLEVIDDERYEYDPKLTVVKIGHIDRMDDKNHEFFESLDKYGQFG